MASCRARGRSAWSNSCGRLWRSTVGACGCVTRLDFVPCLFLNGRMAKDDEPICPMTLGGMRRHGVRGLFVTCQHCRHERAVSMDGWPDDPGAILGPRMRCSRCGKLGATVASIGSNGPTVTGRCPVMTLSPRPERRRYRWHAFPGGVLGSNPAGEDRTHLAPGRYWRMAKKPELPKFFWLTYRHSDDRAAGLVAIESLSVRVSGLRRRSGRPRYQHDSCGRVTCHDLVSPAVYPMAGDLGIADFGTGEFANPRLGRRSAGRRRKQLQSNSLPI
jgi:hypothetical protein